MNFLRQSTSAVINFGPVVDKTDGVTLLPTLATALDNTSTGIRVSKNGGVFTARHATVTGSVYDARGQYRVTLDTTDTNTLGTLRLVYEDGAACLPIWQDCTVLNANVYDSLIAGSDTLQTHMVELASGLIAAGSFASDTNAYQAKIGVIDDDTGTSDRYIAVWFKNGQPVTTGITGPTIQVIKASDGSDLVASTSMTQIGTTGTYRYNEASNRIMDGAAYVVKITASIDSGTRTWFQWVGMPS